MFLTKCPKAILLTRFEPVCSPEAGSPEWAVKQGKSVLFLVSPRQMPFFKHRTSIAQKFFLYEAKNNFNNFLTGLADFLSATTCMQEVLPVGIRGYHDHRGEFQDGASAWSHGLERRG
ncbi:hypothetical protein [Desulfonatronospira thiodismutans]|uniref:hypothetical protein n=1 Tax=Desulfonatronospira thiodismutans TaxID=488939 RepID=UPI001ABF1E99|nr:hypothetical protein [Desulfonatronospira thiodismutans]